MFFVVFWVFFGMSGVFFGVFFWVFVGVFLPIFWVFGVFCVFFWFVEFCTGFLVFLLKEFRGNSWCCLLYFFFRNSKFSKKSGAFLGFLVFKISFQSF